MWTPRLHIAQGLGRQPPVGLGNGLVLLGLLTDAVLHGLHVAAPQGHGLDGLALQRRHLPLTVLQGPMPPFPTKEQGGEDGMIRRQFIPQLLYVPWYQALPRRHARMQWVPRRCTLTLVLQDPVQPMLQHDGIGRPRPGKAK